MTKLLVIDDEPLTLECFRLLFPDDHVRVLIAETAQAGVALMAAESPDVVVMDIRLPDRSGLETFRELRELDARTPIILVTGYGTANTAIEAMRLGAFEYLLKPFDTDALRELVDNAFEVSRLSRVPATIGTAQAADGQLELADILIGGCPAMQEVYKAIGRVAGQKITVLIRGESGTGKELVARAIYHYSARAERLLLTVNCAAIPEALLESELFGHERGSFTHAERRRIGKFEQSDGGTLFLDEVADMTPLTQAKVLRVLQDQTFERVGGSEPIQSDVRILAATNRDLETMIDDGRFRSDLYYRLNGYTIWLPPLRERGDDLLLLAQHFVARLAREMNKEVLALAPETVDLLRAYPWPGNVRELQAVLRQAVLLSAGQVLLPESLPASIRTGETDARAASGTAPILGAALPDLQRLVAGRLQAGAHEVHAEVLAVVESQVFVQVLEHVGYNLTQAARLLGISRTTLRQKLAAYGIAIARSTTIGNSIVAGTTDLPQDVS